MSTPMETRTTTRAGRAPDRSGNVARARRAGGLDEPEAASRPDQLCVKEFDFQMERNRQYHHTSDYEIQNLFVRRGQRFDLDVTFNKVPKTEMFALELTLRGTDDPPAINLRTLIRLPFNRSQGESPGRWGISVGAANGPKYSLVVSSPPDAFVGRYSIAVVIVDSEDAESRYFEQKDPIYVLFNAWCEEDAVYMPGEEEKFEYVLNDEGEVFVGAAKFGQQYGRPWLFGQFEEVTTNVVFDLLYENKLDKSRGDPVYISRQFTHYINQGSDMDKQAILVGNWSGDYEDGKRPSSWTGSTAIFEILAKTGKPVKYGQCWVFSGVLCTTMRCLGIPCRSVTNFSSAHDTDGSMTVDTVLDYQDFDEISALSADSVWNFHVWNETYFTRPDLPHGMGGWQVIDATPQEKSDERFQMGPAPKAAIKQGLTYMNYETMFAFAEVNADRITWLLDKKGDMKILDIKKKAVGKYISTKKLPSEIKGYFDSRKDITREYKYEEEIDGKENPEERMAVERAVSYGVRPSTYGFDKKNDDVSFEILLAEQTPCGSDLDVKVEIHNRSSVSRRISVKMNVYMCYYTGVPKGRIADVKQEVTVPSGKSTHALEPIKAEFYSQFLVDKACIKFSICGKVQETSQQVVAQDSVLLTPPKMKVEADVKGYEVEVTAEFLNPLPVALTGCTLTVEAPRILHPMTFHPNSDVPPKGKFSYKFSFKPRTRGIKKKLIVDFDSKQLDNVIGSVEVQIP